MDGAQRVVAEVREPLQVLRRDHGERPIRGALELIAAGGHDDLVDRRRHRLGGGSGHGSGPRRRILRRRLPAHHEQRASGPGAHREPEGRDERGKPLGGTGSRGLGRGAHVRCDQRRAVVDRRAAALQDLDRPRDGQAGESLAIGRRRRCLRRRSGERRRGEQRQRMFGSALHFSP
jgi:hypothetical protein